MVEEQVIRLENNSIESVINKEVRKIFGELNIYTFVTYCYNKKRGFFIDLFVYYNMIKKENIIWK